MTRFFDASYYQGGSRYGSIIAAEDREEARLLAMQRGIGETVYGEFHPPGDASLGEILSRDPLTADDYAAAMHAACWLGFIALSSGVASPREILGDKGLVHEIAHLAGGIESRPEKIRDEILKLAFDLERRVPGWAMKPYPNAIPPRAPFIAERAATAFERLQALFAPKWRRGVQP